MTFQWYLIDGVNPEPWAASEGAIGKKNGKTFIHFHKPEQLRQYQESVKDMFVEQNPHFVELAGDIEIIFYFWRQLPSFEVGEGKTTRRSAQADATNLQKALEDALQGILYENDRDIRSIRSVVVEQSTTTEPAVLINAGSYGDDQEISDVRTIRATLTVPKPEAPSNIRNFDVGEVF